MKKVVLTTRLHEEGMKVLEGKADVRMAKSAKPEDLAAELADADAVIIRLGAVLDRDIIMKAEKLRAIGWPGVGLDRIDVPTATGRGIPVVIAPGTNTRSVAEHAFALMFAAAKDIVNCDSQTRIGNFNVRDRHRSFELAGKRVGIIGFGSTGREMAKMVAAIGMQVSVFSPSADQNMIAGLGYKSEKELCGLLMTADIISIHCPLTSKTRQMIGAKELDVMKPGAVIVNIARGEIVDERALEDALRKNKIHCAAVDVMSAEPVSRDHPLLKLDNFIITPHIAGQSREAGAASAVMAAEGVLAVLDGKKWPHVADAGVYDHPNWK